MCLRPRLLSDVRRSVRVVVLPHRLAGDGFAGQSTPGVGDVGRDEGDEERDPGHRAEGEFARRRVADCQRRLHLRERRVVGRVVPSGQEQQGQHREHRACTAEPDGPSLPLPPHTDAPEHGDDAGEEQGCHVMRV